MRADDESDRRRYREEIDRLLDGIRSDLDRVAGDSSAGYVDSAISKADEVRTKAQSLYGVRGGDSDADRIGSSYPRYAEKFKDVARNLRELKNGQRSLDELPRRCDDKSKELADKLRSFTDSHDPRGIDEVPRLARELGRTGKDALEQAERKKTEMSQWAGRLGDFSDSDGKWGDVRSSLGSAGRNVWESFQRSYEQVKRDDVCGNLAKEDRNPLIERAMQKLLEGKNGIVALYEQIDRTLTELAASLRDLDRESTASNVDSAERKADDLDRAIDQLDRVRGQDGEARRRVEAYRGAVRSLREALKHLRVLKQGQFLVDRAEQKCSEAESKLRDDLRAYTDSRNTRGVAEIPIRARAVADAIAASLAKADEQHKVMDSERNEAMRFSVSEGRWRDVMSNLQASSNAIGAYWKKAWETAHQKCDELTRGENHPLVKMALEQLRGGARTLIDAYRKDVDAWFDLTRESFKMDCAAMNELWSASCEGVDWEKDTSDGEAQAKAVAARIAAERSQDGRRLLELYEQLKQRGELLAKDAEIGEQARVLLEQMRKRRHGAVQTMIDGGAGRGYQHPLIQFAQRYGIERHQDMGTSSSYKCDVIDQPVPGTDGRPDCISADLCTIFEFKPDSPTGRTAYNEQRDRYLRGVNEFFTQSLSSGSVPSFSGGQQIYNKLLQNKSCWDPGTRKTNFIIKPEYYRVCEKKFECVQP